MRPIRLSQSSAAPWLAGLGLLLALSPSALAEQSSQRMQVPERLESEPLLAESNAEIRQAITAALQGSTTAWCHDDLERFMAVYADSPDTVFVTQDQLVRGYAAIRATYQATYGRTAHLGVLRIDILRMQMLGVQDVLASGRYHLIPAESGRDEQSGLTTLLFHRYPQGWKISYDHSS